MHDASSYLHTCPVHKYDCPLCVVAQVTLTTILWGMEQSFLCPDTDDVEICGKGRTEDVFRQSPFLRLSLRP